MPALPAVLALAAVAVLLAAGCGTSETPPGEAVTPPARAASDTTGAAETSPSDGSRRDAQRVDPRDDGLEVALGEWALTAESLTIRPGRVTFVVTNRGSVPHGFELESEDRRDANGDRRDRDERFKHETRVLAPGETARLTLDLPPGVYKLECLVDGHDDLGMEEVLEVREDAPLTEVEPEAERDDSASTVRIEVTWTNDDEADHTVTHEGGAFSSKTLARGETFRFTFDRPGTLRYVCALHPGMRGTVTVR